MKKAVYRLILFAAITAFVLFLSPSVKAEPNDTQTNQNQYITSDTKPLSNADKPEPAPHQKSAVSKENSQLQLAKEQLRGDFYKDSQDNLKLALVIIVTFVVGLVLYTIFKDRKEYEKACENAEKAYNKAELSRTQAEQSREKAREHELKAQEKLASINQLVADKLKEIDAKAKETMLAIKAEAKAGQVEIEKKGKEERQKSLEEAGRQRKISELFSKAWKAKEAKDYETAADCYRQIVEELKEENDPHVYYNWGTSLLRLAENKKGTEAEELSNQAIEKYKKALDIKPDYHIAYNNWGNALCGLAKHKKGKEAEELSNQAIEKYKKALEIKPDYCTAYHNWGDELCELAKSKKGKETEKFFKQAEEKLLKAESLETGRGAYNLACVYALRGNEEKCQQWLKVGEKAGTLNTREYAMADDDLKSVREKEWFKKLRWRGE